jgi:Ca2+-transporting ATPase
MGINGTDVSRSVADLILKDDNFATIVAAIAEGRAIFNNIRKFTAYQLSCNYAELAIIFIGVLFAPVWGWPVPVLLALHILFMNVVTDNLPAITLGFNNSSVDIMNEPPRKKAQILTRDVIWALALSAFIMTSLSLATFWLSYNVLGQSVVEARSLTLLVLIVLEIVGAFSFRSFRQSVLGRSLWINKYLVWASVISLVATVVIIYTPLDRVFETTALGGREWFVAVVMGLVSLVIFDSVKWANAKWKFARFE